MCDFYCGSDFKAGGINQAVLFAFITWFTYWVTFQIESQSEHGSSCKLLHFGPCMLLSSSACIFGPTITSFNHTYYPPEIAVRYLGS